MNSGRSEGRSGCFKWLAIGLAGAAALYAFRTELLQVWSLVKPFVDLATGKPAGMGDLRANLDPLLFSGFLLVTALGFFVAALWFVSQWLLPVGDRQQKRRAFSFLFAHLIGARPTSIFLSEGALEIHAERRPEGAAENTALTPGLAFVDPSSALVVERVGALGLLPGSRAPKGGPHSSWVYRNIRVALPGLTFYGSGEKILGTVLLRKQFRREADVPARTSDGLEVRALVFVLFTLGQRPKVLRVAYQPKDNAWEPYTPRDLRVIRINETTGVIESLADELDEQDALDIHNWVAGYTFSQPAELVPEEAGNEYPPYAPDPARIYAALRSQGRQVSDDHLEDWTTIPLKEAVALYRNHIAKVKFDYLYGSQGNETPPLRQVKMKYAQAMRRKGVTSFQFIRPQPGVILQPGQVVDASCFDIFPVQDLPNTELLRTYGIKIIHAGFSEPKADPAIHQQRVENWRSHWQKEADLAQANHDLEVAQIRNKVRAQTQGEMVRKLAQIFKGEHSEEGLAATIFQALEAAAAEQATRNFLPNQTLDNLQNLRAWMDSGQDEMAEFIRKNELKRQGQED